MASVFGSFGSSRRGPAAPDPGDRRPRIDGYPVDRIPAVIAEARRGRRRRVTTIGEDVLARPCREVTAFGTPGLRALIDDMHATMACCHGVGLAANQIGVNLRVFVYDCEDAYGVRHVGHVLNPRLESAMEQSGGRESSEEGCLSVPGPVAEVQRARVAVVRGVDMFGKPVTVEGTGTLARCLQHECDHLEGRLYVDRLGARDRKKVLKSMEELRASTWAAWDARAAELGKESSAQLSPEPPTVDDVPAPLVAIGTGGTEEWDAGIVDYDPAAYAEADTSGPSPEVSEVPEAASYDDARAAELPDEDEARG
ncbi:MAG: peptide deformylase [Austwickia sp.]|jgi:peptide deformylase|nr:MAG: peptide deformylase [Austwickia sp.]